MWPECGANPSDKGRHPVSPRRQGRGLSRGVGAKRQPDHQILYDRWLARTLAHLDTNAYSMHYERGRASTLDEACALAIGHQSALVS